MSILNPCVSIKRLFQTILLAFLIGSSAHADDLLFSIELNEEATSPRSGNLQVFVETDGAPNPYAANGVPPVYVRSTTNSICTNNTRLAGGQIDNAWLAFIYNIADPELDPDIADVMANFDASLLFVLPYGSDFEDGSTGFNEPCFSSRDPIAAGFLILFLFTTPIEQASGQYLIGEYVDCTFDLASCQFYRGFSSKSQLF